MQDIYFNTVTREISIKNGDIVLTDNPSEQNGGILLYAKGFNLSFPLLGVGINDVINAGAGTDAVFELNRWKQQALNDGATGAEWKKLPGSDTRTLSFEIDIDYL